METTATHLRRMTLLCRRGRAPVLYGLFAVEHELETVELD